MCLRHSQIQDEKLAPIWDVLLSWEKEKEQWPSSMMALKAFAQMWHLCLLPTFHWLKASHTAELQELHIVGKKSVLSQVSQSHENEQDNVIFLQGWGEDNWEQKTFCHQPLQHW